MDKPISYGMLRWTSAILDLTNGVEQDKIRQKLGISKIQWREIKTKLRKLALQNGYTLPEEEVTEE